MMEALWRGGNCVGIRVLKENAGLFTTECDLTRMVVQVFCVETVSR